ncbi:sensor histidine kinase [Spirillospora sp. CA-294931]|uniref:sensor histidine kinase n=1 Tax=Spirillospora sp. CA-294931 TaxID=3240042 RepID=UPI003D8C54A8
MASSRLAELGRWPAERARSLPPAMFDAVLVIGCYLTIVINAALHEKLGWGAVALAATASLPLMWRRRYPLGVTTVCGVGTTWLSLVGLLGEFPAAQLLATYTLAALASATHRMLGILGTVVGVTVSILLPHDELLNLGAVGIWFLVAYALGTSARARRARIELLEERARRLAEEHETAAVRERARIAREMHDILAHSMSLVLVQAEAGPVVVRSDPGKAEEVFDNISETAREALAQLRRVLGVLRPPTETSGRRPQEGLDALAELVTGVARRTGLDVRLSEDGAPRPLPADLAATAYRVVQESLTNAVKHAGADAVEVRLRWRAGELCLEIQDDGSGPSASTGKGGRGLPGMRERLAVAGGSLRAGRAPDGRGFLVAARLPIE